MFQGLEKPDRMNGGMNGLGSFANTGGDHFVNNTEIFFCEKVGPLPYLRVVVKYVQKDTECLLKYRRPKVLK